MITIEILRKLKAASFQIGTALSLFQKGQHEWKSLDAKRAR